MREVLRHCVQMLEKWDAPGAVQGRAKRPHAYKGKSPLSSIIAYKTLGIVPEPRDLPKCGGARAIGGAAAHSATSWGCSMGIVQGTHSNPMGNL